MSKLNDKEMKKARKDAFFERMTEEQWGKANDVQKIILHHIELLVQSLEEDDYIREN